MNVSPLDLRQQRFRTSFRGFDKVEVTSLLSAAADDYEHALKETDKLKQEVQKKTSREVFINIQEIQKPELDSQLIAESVATQLERRVAFRRAMRKAVESALRFGARGIKVRVSGRLNGAEIARS